MGQSFSPAPRFWVVRTILDLFRFSFALVAVTLAIVLGRGRSSSQCSLVDIVLHSKDEGCVHTRVERDY